MKLAIALSLAAIATSFAADWPQYRGPLGDGSTPDKIATQWGAAPKILWKVPGGTGFSSFVVSGARCFTLEGFGGKEVLVARNVADGKELWKAELGKAEYQGGGNAGDDGNNGGDGPRSTPTIAGNVIITTNAELVVQGHDATSGKPLWKLDLAKHGARNISWQNAASPLLEGGIIYLAGGGAGESFIALNPASGAIVAKSGDETMTHATPIATTIAGTRQIIFFMKSGLVSLEPKTLKELWRSEVKFNVSTAASPVVVGDYVFASAGYGVGAYGFKITKTGTAWKAEQIMRVPGDREIANHWSTPVHFGGHLYGMFQFKKYGSGPVKAVNLPDGEVKWSKDGFGPGHVVLTNGNVLALSDAGELVIFAAKPDAYQELARAKVLTGKCWTTPVISSGLVFVRSTTEAACIDLRVK